MMGLLILKEGHHPFSYQASLRVYLGLGHLAVFSDFCQILTLPPTVAKQYVAFREAGGGERVTTRRSVFWNLIS